MRRKTGNHRSDAPKCLRFQEKPGIGALGGCRKDNPLPELLEITDSPRFWANRFPLSRASHDPNN